MKVDNGQTSEDNKFSRRTIIGSTAVAAAVSTFPGNWSHLVVAQNATPTGGEFRAGNAQDAVSFHPFKETDTASFGYIDLVNLLPLLRYNADSMELEPFAAESFEMSEDNLTVTYTLLTGLVWSDGEPVTADDYAWTFSQAIIEDSAWPRFGSYEPFIESVEATDDQTLVVTLKEAIAIGLEKATFATQYVLPRHVWEELDWNDPEANPEIMKPSVSCGPFTVEEWRKDQYASFKANESFFLGRANFDTYTVQLYGNNNTAVEALNNGEINNFGVGNENWPDAKENENLQALEWDSPSNATMYLGFNTRLSIFSTKEVRQALNFAFDKELITSELTYGLGTRATGMYLPTSWVYNPDVEKYLYDTDKANQILDDAGWAAGDDGVREKDGERLSFQFIYGPNNDPIREQIATVCQEMWAEVGAEVEVLGMEWGAFLSATREGPYDWGCFLNMYIPSVDPDIIWFKREAGDAYNRSGFQNEEIFTLYEEGLAELDREKRKEIYMKIQEILADESPWAWVYSEKGFSAFTNNVTGLEVDALGLNDIWEWGIES